MDELLELAERCERASCGDRMLEVHIAKATQDLGPWANYSDEQLARTIAVVPSYTTSLDAAMTLVPAAAMDHVEIYRPDHQTLGWTVYLMANANFRRPAIQGFAKTLALAFAAAALRARATPIHPDNERLQEAEKG